MIQIVHVKLNPVFPWQNQHPTGRRNYSLQQIGLYLRKELANCYIWGIVCYGVETGTLRKLGQKYLERVEMWCWKKM
jgi:hypothetical protein